MADLLTGKPTPASLMKRAFETFPTLEPGGAPDTSPWSYPKAVKWLFGK